MIVVYIVWEALNAPVKVAREKSTVIIEGQVPASFGAIPVDDRTFLSLQSPFAGGMIVLLGDELSP